MTTQNPDRPWSGKLTYYDQLPLPEKLRRFNVRSLVQGDFEEQEMNQLRFSIERRLWKEGVMQVEWPGGVVN
ncbi:MAG: hypothetical protein HY731_12010, partial [Candidatus Tectomicrobia bacterium]|nr:hypothetical protein [Candidatus Tectomicrobia bacterium]